MNIHGNWNPSVTDTFLAYMQKNRLVLLNISTFLKQQNVKSLCISQNLKTLGFFLFFPFLFFQVIIWINQNLSIFFKENKDKRMK